MTNGEDNGAALDPEEAIDKLIVDGPSVPTHTKLRNKKGMLSPVINCCVSNLSTMSPEQEFGTIDPLYR